MRKAFDEVFEDVTKHGTKIKTDGYHAVGTHIIIDQGQEQIAGYTDLKEGVFSSVPALIFGDHTRVVKYVDKPFFLGADGVKVLRSKFADANYRYLYYALKSIRIPNTGYNRHFKWLKESTIEYPDIKEQQSIVFILDKISKLIDSREAELQKLDDLIKARFVEMFGDPVSNPKGWEKKVLSDEAEIKIGPFGSLLHKEDYITGGHALVNPSHIVDGRIVPDDDLTVSDEKYSELEAYHLKKGDVVMGRRGEMGRCAVVEHGGLLCGTGSLLIRSYGDLSADYIQKIISFPSFKRKIEDMAVGQTMPNLNVPIVSEFQIIKPPKNVQEQYYAFVTQVDKSKFAITSFLKGAFPVEMV